MKAQKKAQAVTLIGILSLIHAGIDFLCAFSLYHSFWSFPQVFLLYNFCAFALQMLLGLIADILNDRRNEKTKTATYFTVAGILLTIIGSFLSPIVLGIGNAFFHVGGGMLSIHEDRKMKMNSAGLGIFVAPGAIGLILGILNCQTSFYKTIQIAVSVLLIVLGIYVLRNVDEEKRDIEVMLPQSKRELFGIILCFLVVVLRSLAGMAISFSWKVNAVIAFISVLFIASGKTAGGFLFAKLGSRKMIVITLLLSALLYAFGNHTTAGLLALFFFNMTMPVTLYLLAEQMKELPGFAFGILTFGLFIGYLPVLYGWTGKIAPFPFGSIISLLSMFLLLLYVRIREDE